ASEQGRQDWYSRQTEAGPAMDKVRPGRYTALATTSAPWYIDSIRCGSTDLAKEELVVAAGQQEPIDVILRDDSASVHGQLKRSGEQANSVVLLVPDSGAPPFTIVTGGEQGRFGEGGIPPGGYLVLAFDDLTGLEYSYPDVLRPYLPKANHLILQLNRET